jgi:MmyB-like transcription regulator ligand binding domain
MSQRRRPRLLRRPATPTRRRRRRQRVRPGVQRMLDAMTGAPAFVCNPRLDILATNRLGRALYSEMFEGAVQPPNTARFTFLDPKATDLYVDWERVANEVVAILRSRAGRDPYDRDLSDLVGELSTQSEIFRKLWLLTTSASTTPAPRLSSPSRRRAQLDLRDDGALRRHGSDDVRVHRRARFEVRGGAEPPRELGGDARPGGTGARASRTLISGERS